MPRRAYLKALWWAVPLVAGATMWLALKVTESASKPAAWVLALTTLALVLGRLAFIAFKQR